MNIWTYLHAALIAIYPEYMNAQPEGSSFTADFVMNTLAGK
jgi:hypothetical protein